MLSYAKYKTKVFILECYKVFQFFYLLLEFDQSFNWHEKESSTLF